MIHSTGDSHYVGLAGIEHSTRAACCRLRRQQGGGLGVAADINELEEYSDDPRTPEKLLDGTNATSDDMHVWLAPHARRATV